MVLEVLKALLFTQIGITIGIVFAWWLLATGRGRVTPIDCVLPKRMQSWRIFQPAHQDRESPR